MYNWDKAKPNKINERGNIMNNDKNRTQGLELIEKMELDQNTTIGQRVQLDDFKQVLLKAYDMELPNPKGLTAVIYGLIVELKN